MAIVPRDLKNGKTTYYVTFTWQGRTVWERSGTSKREAASLEGERKSQVALGTYRPSLPGGSRTTVETWFAHYLTLRKNRSLENDISLLENHVLSHAPFASMRLAAVEPRDVLALVEHLNSVKSIGGKTVAIIYGLVRQAFGRAAFERVIDANPCDDLPRGSVKWKSRRKRKPYSREEVRRLMACEAVPLDYRVFIALAFYTGMREGEVCGRRFRDWDRSWQPLSCLTVDTQYDGQPLKTDDGEDVRPRQVPVHVELEAILDLWERSGFELVFLRKPTPEDYMVPHRKIGVHSKSSAYKAWRRALARAGVENRSLHSTRHTFISILRSNGAAKDVVESITHNARGDVLDGYTEFEWVSRCRAVALFDVSVDRKPPEAAGLLQSLDSNQGDLARIIGKASDSAGNSRLPDGPKTPRTTVGRAVFDARQNGPTGPEPGGFPEGANGPNGPSLFIPPGDLSGAVAKLRAEAGGRG